MKLIQNP